MKVGKVITSLVLSSLIISGCATSDTEENKNEETEVEVSNIEDNKETETNEVEEGNEEVVDEETTTAEDVKEGFTLIDFEGIQVEIPEDLIPLELEERDYSMTGYFLDPMTGTNFNIVFDHAVPEGITLEEYIESATSSTGFEYLSKDYFNVEDLYWNESISLNHTDNGTVQLSQRTFLIDGKGFIFTYGSTPELFEDNLELFRTITESVKVVE